MVRRFRLRACLAALLTSLLLVTQLTPANAELQHPRQQFLRSSTAGLFLHWGMRTSPGYTSCSAWENAVKAGGWDPAYWVSEARKLHTQYLVLATFHSRLGYARPWPSAIPGSCRTQRDILRETIDAAAAHGLKVVLYMTDDPQWQAEGLPAGKSWLDSAGYSQYKGRSVDLSTRDGFGEFSYDNFAEVMKRYPTLGGFWIDNDNAYWERNGLYERIRRERPDYTLSNNNEDTPVMDMISNEQKTGMSPAYDYPQAVYTAAPRLIEADFKLPSTGSWWYGGSDPAVDARLTIGRLISNAGSSVKSLMAETAMVDGRFPPKQEQFNNLIDKYLPPIWPSIDGTEGGGYAYGGLQPGFWNDGAHGVTTISKTANALGLGGSRDYNLKDLWTKATRTTTGTIAASVPAHATVLYRVSRAGTTTRHEAETASYPTGSTIDKNHSGYSGTGFVNTPNAAGSYVQWTVQRAEAGQATLVFDHANGTTSDRPMDISVNGSVVKQNLTFPGTGAWSLWRTNYTTVNLAAGTNVIRATATSTDGTPNLDYLEIAS